MMNNNQTSNLEIIYYKIYTEEVQLQNKYNSKKKSRRTENIKIRLSKEDYDYIESKSTGAGMTKSQFLINAAKQTTCQNLQTAIPLIVNIDEKINKLPAELVTEIRPAFNKLKDEIFNRN